MGPCMIAASYHLSTYHHSTAHCIVRGFFVFKLYNSSTVSAIVFKRSLICCSFVCNSHMFKFVKFSPNVSTLDLVINFALRDVVASSAVTGSCGILVRMSHSLTRWRTRTSATSLEHDSQVLWSVTTRVKGYRKLAFRCNGMNKAELVRGAD